MPDFTKVNAGDGLSIPAAVWNAVQDSARDYLARRGGETASGSLLSSIFPSVTVLVRNGTGSTLAGPGVLALGDPVISAVDEPQTVQQQPGFEGGVPAAATDAFAVMVEAVESDGFGRGVVSGVAVCDIDVTDAAHEYAAPTPGDETQLTSAASGPARIVWKESGTGTKRAVVIVGQGGGIAAGDCCGWCADYWTKGFGAGDSLGSGTTPEIAQTITIPGGANLIVYPAICRIPAGDYVAEVRAGINVEVALPAAGTQPTFFKFQVAAQLVARYVTPGGVGSGAWSPLNSNNRLLGVCSGQRQELSGGTAFDTGDTTATFPTTPLTINWRNGRSIVRAIQAKATHDIEVTWKVLPSLLSLSGGSFGGAIYVTEIGRGGTYVVYQKQCCADECFPVQVVAPAAAAFEEDAEIRPAKGSNRNTLYEDLGLLADAGGGPSTTPGGA